MRNVERAAPAPGSVRIPYGQEPLDMASPIITFRWRENHLDKTVSLAMGNLGPLDGRRVRKETGVPLEAFVGEVADGVSGVGLDTVCVLLWLARIRNGEPKLKLSTVESLFSYDTVPDVEVDDGTSDPDGSPDPTGGSTPSSGDGTASPTSPES